MAQLTRADFHNSEDWYRYCHEGGLRPFDPDEPYGGISVTGFYSGLAAGIYGHSRRQHQRTFEGFGTSRAISAGGLLKTYRAAALANCRGRVLNAHICISWSTVGVTSDLTVANYLRLFLERVRKWLAAKGYWAAWLWTLERGNRYGLHSHILAHIPVALRSEFRAFAERSLAHLLRRPLLKTSESSTLWMEVRAETAVEYQWRIYRYLMKALDHRICFSPAPGEDPHQVHLALKLDVRPQGEVVTKRVGVSRELDAASLRRWQATFDLPDMKIVDDPGRQHFDSRFWDWFDENRHLFEIA